MRNCIHNREALKDRDQACEEQKRKGDARVAEPPMEQSSEEFDLISTKMKESLVLYRYRFEYVYRRK